VLAPTPPDPQQPARHPPKINFLPPLRPAGIDTGAKLRVKGAGCAGRRGGPPGDAYAVVTVRPHPDWQRDGADVHSDVEVSYTDAILGATVAVPTVHGPAEMKVPPGVQPGAKLRMRGRGAPKLGDAAGARGDHYAHLRVRLPKAVGDEERRHVEALRELEARAAAAAHN
jgi:molecular chaperone DnaJ